MEVNSQRSGCSFAYRAPKGKWGFTLIELMVTIAIVAILMALAAPAMSNFVLNGRAKQAASDIWASMSLARSEALKRNANVSVGPVGSDWRNGWQVTAGTEVVTAHEALSNQFDSLSLGTLTYGRDGRLTTASTEYVFTLAVAANSGVTKRCVYVRASGMPVIQVDNNRDGNCGND